MLQLAGRRCPLRSLQQPGGKSWEGGREGVIVGVVVSDGVDVDPYICVSEVGGGRRRRRRKRRRQADAMY